MKRKDSNCVGILSDQGEAASNLSEYTIFIMACYIRCYSGQNCPPLYDEASYKMMRLPDHEIMRALPMRDCEA